MNTLDLKGFGVQEMGAKEMEVIDGGGFPFWMIGVGIYLYDNRDSFVAGMKDAVNAIL
ncbi:hypothetical protein [Sphingobacterium sp.]|uniref:hypothetical protein n=1 Tax=Sphingobacterium sp. TaxID=341027 RepID=UPI00289A2045|nr:hypothetical protein [Sphingobacterium sp.]